MGVSDPPESRYPPKENSAPKVKMSPKPGTAWERVQAETADVRCMFRDEHLHVMFHALGINPNCPWPPPPELEFFLREAL